MLPPNVEVDHEYSVIEIDGDPRGMANAYNWCIDTFGPPGNRWFRLNRKLYFKHEKDYFWFEMRW